MDELLQGSAPKVARQLIGWYFYKKESDNTLTGGVIIETEAYNQDDAASHSFKGVTPRTEVMFGPAGRLYVYFTYGMHWCANIVVGQEGRGEAVLLRSLKIDKGIERVRARRKNRPYGELTNGPAKLCQALDITGNDNGAVLGVDGFVLLPPLRLKTNVRATERIGITKDTHRLWRFVANA